MSLLLQFCQEKDLTLSFPWVIEHAVAWKQQHQQKTQNNTRNNYVLLQYFQQANLHCDNVYTGWYWTFAHISAAENTLLSVKKCKAEQILYQALWSFANLTSSCLETVPSKNLNQKHQHADHCEVQQEQWRDLANCLCTNCLVWYVAKSPQQNTLGLSVLQPIQVQTSAGSSQTGTEVCSGNGACLWTRRLLFVQLAPAEPILGIPWLSFSMVQFCVQWPESGTPKVELYKSVLSVTEERN